MTSFIQEMKARLKETEQYIKELEANKDNDISKKKITLAEMRKKIIKNVLDKSISQEDYNKFYKGMECMQEQRKIKKFNNIKNHNSIKEKLD